MTASKKPPQRRTARATALSPKQQRFIAEYLVDLNATQAAIRAGYSPNGADVQGVRLLANARVAQAVTEGQAARLRKLDLSAERVLTELMRLAFSDTRKVFTETGALKAPKDWDDETAAAIAAVEVVEMAGGAKVGGAAALEHVPMYTKKVKLWDKKGALELLGKHLGLLKEKVEHSGGLSISWQDSE